MGILMFVFALFGAYKAVSTPPADQKISQALLSGTHPAHAWAVSSEVWTIRILSMDREAGTVTLRAEDLSELVVRFNHQVDQIAALKRLRCL